MKTFQKALAVGVLAVTSSLATAAPIFSFTEYGGFTDDVGIAVYTNQVTVPVGEIPAASPIYSTMSWNENFGVKSHLNLTTYQNALAVDTWTSISTLTHTNNIIQGSVNWSGQDIWGRLRINDSDGGLNNVLDSDEAITIGLTETTNANCPAPNPVGTTCDDFFSFTESGLTPLFFTANDGSTWLAEFRFENLINAALIGNTIYTGEEGTSSLDVQVRVSAVPEPATLGMFGLGLLGLGLAKRRKQNA